MVINMLSRNSEGYRADCAMLDFEDSMKPSWANVIDGIHNVIGACRGDLSYTDPKSGKEYAIDANDEGTVMVRVRGLHLEESNILVDGEPVAGGILDLASSFYHTAQVLLDRGRTPKYYVPKVEHHLEARWWNTLFSKLETRLKFPIPTLRATFLIETLPGAFQIEEILYELREHAAGLNVGRWDKIFSDIKTLRYHEDRVMADRSWINMERPWMRNYAQRLIHVCHSHGAFALGGMAAHTPGRDAEKREQQASKVLADKRWEFDQGHDGCWVSHPYFIGWAMRAFPRENQLDVMPDIETKFLDLLPTNEGPKTLDGLRTNVRVGIAYMAGWNQDIGCIAWDDLMEDLATLEISRASIWQWLHHSVTLDDGTQVDKALVSRLFEEELERIFEELGDSIDRDFWTRAKTEAFELFTQETFQEFLSFKSDLVG
jgi:malate synthase